MKSMLGEVEKHKSEGVFEVVAGKAPASEVIERPIQPTTVCQEEVLEKAWNRLMSDDGVGIMGLHGMGGVGKTTLLTQINNNFTEKNNTFDVIWVEVSKELQIQKIQNQVAKKLGLDGDDWSGKDEKEKACAIHNVLKRRKFVLLMDDLWEKVELTEIGVPYPERKNGCKIVFTTRSKEVCGRMRVDAEMEVQCLLPEDALELFKKVVGETTLRSDPGIPELAAQVAKKCHGLPLALKVIGEAMSFKRTSREWEYAIRELNSNAAKFSKDMGDKILPVLKFSYDNLEEENLKSCFLYCALVRDDGLIYKAKLIGYWIGEGMIDASEGIEMAENKGYEIIDSLVRASLLMEVEPERRACMRMHDVVREMALWIASDFGKEEDAFIVHAGSLLSEMPNVKNWKVVRRISLMDNSIKHLVGSPECLQLTTFLVNGNRLEDISMEFFKSMPKLLVLDLSGNDGLLEMPDGISKLVSLQYLNLSFTGIRHLPMGLLQELEKLIYLELPRIETIAGISRLQNLKILRLIFPWEDLNAVEELETLQHLEVLYTRFEDNHPLPLEKFFSSHRLTSCTRQIYIADMDLESSGLSLPVTMDKLKDFRTYRCRISEIKMGTICNKSKTVTPLHNPRNICFSSLSSVLLVECECLKELTFLMFAPNLTVLIVGFGKDVEDIINREKACGGEESGIVLFSKLYCLWLFYLPKLKNIYWSPLLLPSLEEIKIVGCPNLKKLPLSSQSGKQGEDGLIIRYREDEWIEGVEWEDEPTKTRFLSSSLKY
ncbi:Disease resistance protein (NBS-LRR class) family [Raphanus sativus]|nr:Disease resistance protein (NBS-LRR class) family [Raphanus sativus]